MFGRQGATFLKSCKYYTGLIISRGHTTAVDAYLTPAIKRYLEGFASGFKDDLKGVNVLFMQSDGGLTPMDCFNGSRAILSGPAGETDFTYYYF